VQVAHGGHEGWAAEFSEPLAQFAYGVDDVHGKPQ
jgi:hypothetical protein